MTKRTGHGLGRRVRALAAIVMLVALAVPARGATSVDLEVHPLLAGRYSAGGWLSVAVALRNDGAPTEGYVAADSSSGTVRRYVELPAGSRKSVALYLRPDAFQRKVDVRFESAEGNATASADIRVLERSSRQALIIGDGQGNLRPQILASGDASVPEPLSLAAGDLPERPEPLAGISVIVWAGDSATLSEPQRRSLARWVADGGQLVVVGGPDWQARSAAFADLLPVETIATVEGLDLAGLADFTGVSAPDGFDGSAAPGIPRSGATVLAASARGGQPLLSLITRGAGRVVYSAVDLATAPFRGWEGAAPLWARLLPHDSWADQFFGPGFEGEQQAEGIMSQAVASIPSLEVPPAELLLVIIVGYILLIGPISYLVLRRLDRRELAWISAPVLVVLFSACSYGVGNVMKGGDIIVNQISIVRSAGGGDAATTEIYAGIFSPTRATYDLAVDADALIAPASLNGFEPVPNRGDDEAKYLIEQGDPAHLRGLSLGVFGFQAVRADALTAHDPGLEVDWRVQDDELTGTVTNVADKPAEDVAVISTGGGKRIGDLEPGASADFSLSLSGFSGAAASEQVYGFGGWDPSSEDDRKINVRRQVIDALVGYGGFVPGRVVGAGGGFEQGPYVIGWRVGEPTVPVTVDGQAVQRHDQVVEVISGRPALGPGEVRLDPGQLSVQVVATDGDASASEPGFVTIGNGEVVFAIALPLEASGLVPSKLDILVGPDPGMVLSEPGGFGGFFGPGFTVSVRDTGSGEWIELGDLSLESRFSIDDPLTAISATGRIEVRVVGNGVNPDFGQTGVFASAAVTGVIGQ